MNKQTLLKQRKEIFSELRILSDALIRPSPEGITFFLHGLKITSVFCNGQILMMLWEYLGKEDLDFPLHAHKGIIEHMGVLYGSLHCVVGDEEQAVKTPGQHVLIPAGVPHKVYCKADEGVAKGWALLIPPEDSLIPRSQDGAESCLLAATGRCGADPEECLKRKLFTVE